jgi:hypothetical protein
MHEVIMFAWQMARWDSTAVALSFGMSPAVISTISALTPHQIRTIASRESQAVQIRWANNLAFWKDLLVAAQAGRDEKLAALQLEAKLMLCAEPHALCAEPPSTPHPGRYAVGAACVAPNVDEPVSGNSEKISFGMPDLEQRKIESCIRSCASCTSDRNRAGSGA